MDKPMYEVWNGLIKHKQQREPLSVSMLEFVVMDMLELFNRIEELEKKVEEKK